MTETQLNQYLTQIEDVVSRLKESDLSKFSSSDIQVVKELLNAVEWIGDLLRANEPE